jgi:hypothetical protein
MRLAGPALGALLCALTPRAAAQPPAGALPEAPSYQLSLGSFERDALERALAARGLRLEPHPYGKVVRRLHVVNHDVFGAEEGFLRWFNILHRTSREHVVEREVLLRPGQMWDDALVDETRRRLRDPLFTSLAVVAPVVAEGGGSGQVDVLVVTRDVWSLRTNLRFELQESVLSQLSISLAENNLLGYRKHISLVFDMDLGTYTLGPQYIDRNIAGTRLQLIGKVDAIFNRDTSDFEGTKSVISFGYPLWSLRREWGAGIVFGHFDGVRRAYGPGPRVASVVYVDPETGEEQLLPYEYDERDLNVETSVVRQLGERVKHRVTVGHELDIQRPEVRDNFPGDEGARAAFEAEILPRSERASSLFARYSFFTPVYRTYRNMDSFDLGEDQQLGPDATAQVASAMKPIGSEATFQTGSLTAGWTFDIGGDALARVSGGVAARRQDGELIDKLVTATVAGVSPVLLWARIASRFTWSRRRDETNNRTFSLGGDTGLRGYAIGEFRTVGANPVRFLGNVELRTLPLKVLFTRAGGILFWDFGHAADCYAGCETPLRLHHDVGIGIRALIPQLQPYVLRLDWAIPLTGTAAGFPGRIVAGVQQVF